MVFKKKILCVFLIDSSGSMMDDKYLALHLIQQIITKLQEQYIDSTKVYISVVEFGNNPHIHNGKWFWDKSCNFVA